MDKFQERELRQFLGGMMPSNYQFPEFWKYTIDRVISLYDWKRFAAHPEDERERVMFEGFAERYSKRLIEDIGQELLDQMLNEIARFHTQCMEYNPSERIADVENVPYTIVKDYDGYLMEETRYRTIYHLKENWRGFRAGQSIEYHPAERCVGGSVGSHWGLYFPPAPEVVANEPKPAPKQATTDDDDDGYW